ncbi:MAG: glucosaminidase domain-containing protein [Desulfuromonadales bacterium]|nr:glucosaminidase domain-containing protein [Desulfuromonadales bacterium]
MMLFYRAVVIFALLPFLMGLAGCQNYQKQSSSADNATYTAFDSQLHFEVISPQSRHDLYDYFLEKNYSWNTLKQGVPPLIVEKFPDDFYGLAAGSERKKIFFLTLLPMILLVNEEITVERNALLELFSRHDRNETLNRAELDQIAAAAHHYKVKNDPLTDRQARLLLLNRLDKIPPSLALAQAASESAYGTSRFARLGNNLFGEMTFNDTDGIMPLNREQGARHRARVFPTLLDSLRAYINNLNTHPAYQELRQIRRELQLRGEVVRGMELARGLELYSTRKEAYVDDIRTIIRANNLPKHTANLSLRREVIPPSQPVENPMTKASRQFYGRDDLLSQN